MPTDVLIERCGNALQRYATLREMSKKGHESILKTQKQLDILNGNLTLLERAGAFLRVVSDYSRHKSIGRIENIVNSALMQIFAPRDMKLKIEFDTKSSRVNANLYVTGEKGELEDVMDGRGGGVRDVVSVLLRIMFKRMVHPPLEGPIVLDEALKFLNSADKERNYVLRAYSFIKSIAHQFQDQFIIVTNHDQVSHHGEVLDFIDRMFRVRLVDGASTIETIYEAEKEQVY